MIIRRLAYASPVAVVLGILVLHLSRPATVASSPLPAPSQGFPSYNPAFGPPKGWNGAVFQLSQDYPKQLPNNETHPWTQYDFRTQPMQYMLAARSYIYEGNINRGDDDWLVQKNPVRTWYHMPWRDYGPRGREFMHGLTMEFPSAPGALGGPQKNWQNTYAVGMYNPIAGYAIGQVWPNASQGPNMNHFLYPEGAVITKLLFTTAPLDEVPELQGTYEWQAYIYKDSNCVKMGCARTIQTIRLVQVDIAIKDSRAPKTNWVFGSLVYKYDQPNATSVWDKMVPLGVMWGMDPELTSANPSGKLQEATVFNVGLYEHLGCHGRLSGPVDNPTSACMSCHMTSQYPAAYPIPNKSYACDASPQNSQYWQDLAAGSVFQQPKTTYALDYSQELASSVQNYFMSKGNPQFSPDGKTYKLKNDTEVYQVIRRGD